MISAQKFVLIPTVSEISQKSKYRDYSQASRSRSSGQADATCVQRLQESQSTDY